MILTATLFNKDGANMGSGTFQGVVGGPGKIFSYTKCEIKPTIPGIPGSVIIYLNELGVETKKIPICESQFARIGDYITLYWSGPVVTIS